ncbi:DEAD/DEAH box helicase [Cytobacillus horneckiae]|uniref:ATP-dependent helicase n=1 Tax=Cytobacillus horneckiae TaxID=549687 RepID=A0A2N0ZFU0_9BACI|nr:DEAD/DEAH box helicase [Cytobacillus horneckiae]MEC1154396.1 DEAD/DEAH box helicase [Cytobacillus horneckiae]MED2937731.1 DEAD/DEAH box helicase [Cytobacillus horneckiae]PKG28379.1 ATP-dependent helicase [Cytobacillus horneckiae]
MLKTRYIHIKIKRINHDSFLIYALNEKGRPLNPLDWKPMLFHSHAESFYGTMVEDKNIDGIHGFILDSWSLITLFATEQFNRLIEWDWDEAAEICLSSAPILKESIDEKMWMPDFSSWENDEFRWALPTDVIDEFHHSFWTQTIGSEEVKPFVEQLFHHALDHYLNRNKQAKAAFGEKLKALRSEHLSPKALTAYFDEESWQEWIRVSANPIPFTIGLKLEEPAELDDSWELSIFLRGKEDPDIFVDFKDYSNYPLNWHDYEDDIEKEFKRWIQVFPWLQGEKNKLTTQLTEDEAWTFLTEASETLLALGVEILLPSWWQAMQKASMKVKAKVKGSSSNRPSFVGLQAMLDYDWRFSMNGIDLSEEEFRTMVEEKRRLVYIRGRWIKLDPHFVRQIQDLMKQAEKEGLHVRDLIEQELLHEEEDSDDLLNDKAFAKIQIEINRQWKQMVKQLRSIKDIPQEMVPTSFKGELRPYQQLGMSWLLFLRQFGFGAILADDMGLGKTVQLLSYILKVREQGEDGPALIICPTSVLGNWQKEIERFAPKLNVHLHYGTHRLKGQDLNKAVMNADIVLTSYGLTHLDIESLEQVEWSSVSIDEAQNIKNAQTKQSRAVRKLKGKHHIALTGTPMENRLTELWSIFDFTNHGYLGSLGQFHKRFVLPIEKDNDKGKVQQLQAYIRPFLLRRTKKDEDVALNLPDKQEQKEYCPLTAEQASLYEQLVQDTFAQIEKLTGFERKGLILQLLSRLKQLCNHPALYLKEFTGDVSIGRSTKLEKLDELVSAVHHQGESCLIFTQYIEMGKMIQKMLEEKYGFDVPFLNGSVPKSERDLMIERFQKQEFPVFLLSLKAGGTGLNLTAANHVIHYDRWWNPAVENQATDRAYRIGQKRFVQVHKLICTGTLEEKIDAMLDQKQTLNDQIIQSEGWLTELSTDELRDLILLS